MPIITDPDNENQTDKVTLINETPKPRVRSGCTSILVLLDILVNFSLHLLVASQLDPQDQFFPHGYILAHL